MVDMVAEPVCFKFIINTKKNKTFQMEWYVYYHDSNTQKLLNGMYLIMVLLQKKLISYYKKICQEMNLQMV